MTDSAVPAPAVSDASPNVINSEERFGPQATLKLLEDAGLFSSNEDLCAIKEAKYINHMAYGDFSKSGLSIGLQTQIQELQNKARKVLSDPSFTAIVDSGALNKLLSEYAQFRIVRSKEEKDRLGKTPTALKNADEKDSSGLTAAITEEKRQIQDLERSIGGYETSGDYTKAALKRVENLVRMDHFLPVGKLAVESGLIKDVPTQGYREYATDLVNNVVCTAAVRNLVGMMDWFDDIKPVDEVRSRALAYAERQITQPLNTAFGFESENPKLDCVIALRKLFSAQLYAASSEEGLTPQQQAAQEAEAKSIAKDYVRVTMSLVWHYLNEGPAANDSRVVTMRANFKKAMDRISAKNGITFIASEQEAADKAKVLARNSAQDLLINVKDDVKKIEMIKTLAKAAGDPVDILPLVPKSQLIGAVVEDPSDFKTILTPSYVEYLNKKQQDALNKTSYDHALAV